ncbi:MAG: phage gp6-like head-tail connector protein [Anaerocolumna sp.]|jgi:hypothetical protein|nr:phage gp6-like head-tail connector protein [Anaerocolumna sp.]
MAILADVKTLKRISDGSRDNEINIYIRRGTTLISKYLNGSAPETQIQDSYQDALIQYVVECMNKSGNEGLKQFSQGQRSGAYGNELSDSVLALLPLPSATITGA